MSDNDFQRSWTAAGARHATLAEVVAMLRTEAGAAFAAGRDDEAKMARSLANKVDELRKTASIELNDFIAENERRRSYA